MKTREKNNNIGTLHILGAFFVLYGHHCILTGGTVPVLFGTAIHGIGVKLIFLITGYLITKSMWKSTGKKWKSICVYLIKRLGRIYPEFLVCLLLAAFVIGPLFTTCSLQEYFRNPQVFKYVISSLCLAIQYALPGVFTDNPYPSAVNGSLWTIPVEIILYVLVLLLFLAFRGDKNKKRLYLCFTACIILASLIRYTFYLEKTFVFLSLEWGSVLNLMPYFFIGGSVYLYEMDIQKYLNIQIAAFLLFIGAGANSAYPVMNEVIGMFCLSYVVMALCLAEKQSLSCKWIKSEYAYGLYLYGFMIEQCIVDKFYNVSIQIWQKEVIFFSSLFCTYAAAMISYEVVYKQANKLNQKCIAFINKC